MSNQNIWERNSPELTHAFSNKKDQGQGLLENLILLSLEPHLPDTSCRVIDIGGGGGHVGIRMAELGHEVVIVDSDRVMVDVANQNISDCPRQVRKNIKVVHAAGESALSKVGSDYDVLCCHSVIMYQNDTQEFLSEILKVVADQAVISISSINPDSLAMRLGLQSRWKETIATLSTGLNCDTRCISTNNISREAVSNQLSEHGFREIGWYGIGVFTDHLSQPLVVQDPREVFAAEWLAGSLEPYRSIARCFHIIAKKD